MFEVKNHKVFIVTGELSGDRVAAWYVAQERKKNSTDYYEAVGGDFLQAQGVTLVQRFESLNVVGIIEIIRHLSRLLKILHTLVNYIIQNDFHEVMLVDFPGFNMRLAQYLKQRNKNIKITYLSPPQLWCWGAWRIKKLKRYCDDLVVLYPFEVAWYQKRGLPVRWIGSPVYDSLQKYFVTPEENTEEKQNEQQALALRSESMEWTSVSNGSPVQKNMIALLIGSRLSEVQTFTPLIAAVARRFLASSPDVQFVVPLARSLPDNYVKEHLRNAGLGDILEKFIFVQDEHEKFMLLRQCRVALTKPGTITLELALLQIPSVVFFMTSRLTYTIAKLLVTVPYMSLPNLLLNKTVFKEFIQADCSPEKLSQELLDLYKKSIIQDKTYHDFIADCTVLRDMLRNS